MSRDDPRSLGGLEVDPLTCARVVEEVAAADSAAGWSLFNPLSWAYISARLPDEGAEELFGRNPCAVIAGPFHPPMPATPVNGGYRVTGRSPFASNCHDATWIASTVMVMDGGTPRMSASGAPEVLVAFFPSEQCEIIDTWHVMGMRGTGSDDIAVTDVFVPAGRAFPLIPERVPGLHYQGPLYRFSLMGALAATFPPIVLAIAWAPPPVGPPAEGLVGVGRVFPAPLEVPHDVGGVAGRPATIRPTIPGHQMIEAQVLRAYPKSSAARKVIQAHAKCNSAR
jgi:hypothetical protein